ncbi:hypothetical protein Droror1_Dr00010600 [Drosera rotundifolia]
MLSLAPFAVCLTAMIFLQEVPPSVTAAKNKEESKYFNAKFLTKRYPQFSFKYGFEELFDQTDEAKAFSGQIQCRHRRPPPPQQSTHNRCFFSPLTFAHGDSSSPSHPSPSPSDARPWPDMDSSAKSNPKSNVITTAHHHHNSHHTTAAPPHHSPPSMATPPLPLITLLPLRLLAHGRI